MFDAEKLLGKLVGEVVSKGGSWGKGKTSVLGGLGGGSGLMTLIGLGVGAYEILKQQETAPRPDQGGSTPPPLPGAASPFGGSPPPPPPGAATPPATVPVPAEKTLSALAALPAGVTGAIPAGAELAIRMIRIMVAAAHADGVMDAEEERAVLDKLRGADLSQVERMFLLDELHRPQSVDQLTEGISDPGLAKNMYLLAVATVNIDTESERVWLDRLAAGLGLSKELQTFIEEQYRAC